MKKPAIPADDSARVDALHALNILDTPPEERFDRLTRLAKRLFGVPIALVSLVDSDRQWFKSCEGLDACETPRDVSFCGHAILADEIFLISDTYLDARFCDNPLVTGEPGIRFYAGCPLSVADGSRLGTLCIIDREPRHFDEEDLALLKDLARMAEQELAAVQLATMDHLTILSNRRGFDALTNHALKLCRRLKTPASLVYFDLDNFKPINDRYGHPEGDRALIDFASMLKQTFRESDVMGRLGGDEFAVLATNSDRTMLEAALERFVNTVNAHNRKAGHDYDIEFSVGAVEFDPSRHESITDLIAEADAKMFEDKNRGRACAAPAAHTLREALAT